MLLRNLALAGVLTLSGGLACAQEITGKWNASIDTPQGPFAFAFDFVAQGVELTGAMVNEFIGSLPISEGAVDGSDLTWTIVMQSPGGPMTIKYLGTVEGNEMQITSTIQGELPPGTPAETKFTATRAP